MHAVLAHLNWLAWRKVDGIWQPQAGTAHDPQADMRAGRSTGGSALRSGLWLTNCLGCCSWWDQCPGSCEAAPHAVSMQFLAWQAACPAAGMVTAVMAAWLHSWHTRHASASHTGCLPDAGVVGPVLGVEMKGTTILSDRLVHLLLAVWAAPIPELQLRTACCRCARSCAWGGEGSQRRGDSPAEGARTVWHGYREPCSGCSSAAANQTQGDLSGHQGDC